MAAANPSRSRIHPAGSSPAAAKRPKTSLYSQTRGIIITSPATIAANQSNPRTSVSFMASHRVGNKRAPATALQIIERMNLARHFKLIFINRIMPAFDINTAPEPAHAQF